MVCTLDSSPLSSMHTSSHLTLRFGRKFGRHTQTSSRQVNKRQSAMYNSNDDDNDNKRIIVTTLPTTKLIITTMIMMMMIIIIVIISTKDIRHHFAGCSCPT